MHTTLHKLINVPLRSLFKQRQRGREARLAGLPQWTAFEQDLEVIFAPVSISPAGLTLADPTSWVSPMPPQIQSVPSGALASAFTRCSDLSGLSNPYEGVLSRCQTDAIASFRKHFTRDPRAVVEHDQDSGTARETKQTAVHHKWFHFHQSRKPAVMNVSNAFTVWWHITRFSQYQRKHAHCVRAAKREKLKHVIATAAQAAIRHDTFTLFRCIRSLSPRADRKIKLRNSHGQLMSTVEEVACFRSYIRATWQGPDRCHFSGVLQAMPFTRHELVGALAKIPETKTIPPGCAPGAVWRLRCETVVVR